MSKLRQAFEKLDARLDTLYGVAHVHDFQNELDQLSLEIQAVDEGKPDVNDDQTSGGQALSQVSKA